MSALAVETPHEATCVRLPVSATKGGDLLIADTQGVARKKIATALREEQLLVFDFSYLKSGIGRKRLLGLIRQTRSFIYNHSPNGGIIKMSGFSETLSMSVERALAQGVPQVRIAEREFAFSEKTRTVYASGFTLQIEPWQRAKRHRRIYERLVARDGGACIWCGLELSADSYRATIDHVLPRSEGGGNDFNNYVLSCEPCNSHRQSIDAEEWLHICLEHPERAVNVVAVRDAIARAREVAGNGDQNVLELAPEPYVRLPIKPNKDGRLMIAVKDGVARKKIAAALREEHTVVFDFARIKHGTSDQRLTGLLRQTRSFVHDHNKDGARIVITGCSEPMSMTVERAMNNAIPLVKICDREFAVDAKTRTVYASGFTMLIEPFERSKGHRGFFEKLIARDGGACVWCGIALGANSPTATIDHVVPRSAGGVNHLDNYVLACEACNSRRKSVNAGDWMQLCLGRIHQQYCVNVFAVLDAIARAEALGSRSLVPVS